MYIIYIYIIYIVNKYIYIYLYIYVHMYVYIKHYETNTMRFGVCLTMGDPQKMAMICHDN